MHCLTQVTLAQYNLAQGVTNGTLVKVVAISGQSAHHRKASGDASLLLRAERFTAERNLLGHMFRTWLASVSVESVEVNIWQRGVDSKSLNSTNQIRNPGTPFSQNVVCAGSTPQPYKDPQLSGQS